MAQYFQVLSQTDKNTIEELRQYYPNIVENQTVQYVINPEEQQQFQTQQILVSSDQLMVIENQGHLIVDQSAVSYQNPHYVLQENVAEYQERPQQIFYVKDSDTNRPVQIEQQQPVTPPQPSSVQPPPLHATATPPQPIVLNQLQNTTKSSLTATSNSPKPVNPICQPSLHQIQQQTQHSQSPVRQILQQPRTQPPQSSQSLVNQQRSHLTQPTRQPLPIQQALLIQQQSLASQQSEQQPAPVPQLIPHKSPIQSHQASRGISTPQRLNTGVPPLHFTQPELKNNEIAEGNSQQTAVALSDGRIMVLADYKQLLSESKQRNSTPNSTSQESMDVVPPPLKYENSPEPPLKVKSSRGRGRSRKPRNSLLPNTTNSVEPFSDHDSLQKGTRRRNPKQGVRRRQVKKKQSSPENENVQTKGHQEIMAQFAKMKAETNAKLAIEMEARNRARLAQILEHEKAESLRQQSRTQPSQPQQSQQTQQTQQSQQAQQSSQNQQILPSHFVQPHYIIQPPSQHHQNLHCPLPPYVASSQIQQIIENTPATEEYSDSIRMLVLLENGEQRLITFTLPKEPCTIQEILEQVGVPLHTDTKVSCIETSQAGINYLVTVGVQNIPSIRQPDVNIETSNPEKTESLCDKVTKERASPEPVTEAEAPRYVPGLLAVCNHCGYTSENFVRCLRCRYKLPEDVKTRPVQSCTKTNGKKSDSSKNLPNSSDKKNQKNSNIPKSSNGATSKKKKSKPPEPEPVVLTLSSDEDEDSSNKNICETNEIIKRFNNSAVTLSAIKKEPSPSDIQQTLPLEIDTGIAVKGGGRDDSIDGLDSSTTLVCRTIRIGSYRFIPLENLTINAKGLVLKVPTPKDPNDIKILTIERKHMIKVLVNFQKALPVVFYYVTPTVGQAVREQLGMSEGNDLYFDPLSIEEAHRRITILPEFINDDTKVVFKQIYGKPLNIMDELSTREANDILVKTCPKELSKVIANSGCNDIKQLLIYPPGKGGLPINTEDYHCLGQDQFLNDVIIDFYLKYLTLNLPKEEQEKVHVFSTFFYKRLTTKPVKASRRSHPSELDSGLTAAQKRHARVEKWTKSVNLFEKDFVIIPINENCHWFLAIICFPGLDGCVTPDGKPVEVEKTPKKKKTYKAF